MKSQKEIEKEDNVTITCIPATRCYICNKKAYINVGLCGEHSDINNLIQSKEKEMLDKFEKMIDKVVRGEKTSIDMLREELKQKLKGDEK